MRVQSNGLAGANIAAGSGEARSSKQLLGLMRVCSVPKASFPVLQERLVLSVDDFSRIPASAEGNGAEQPKKITSASPTTHAYPQGSNSGTKSKRRSVSQEAKSKRARAPKKTVGILSARIGDCMAGERRKQRKAQCARTMQSRARLPAYSPLTRSLHSLYYVAVACELCVQSATVQARFPSGGDSA